MPISYYSTNHIAPKVAFDIALQNGQAPDGGLYMPDFIPTLSAEKFASFAEMQYHEIAFEVAREFLKDHIEDAELRAITKDAYNFDVPLENVFERKFVMRLDQGPTASFKDFAARMMARLMQYFLKKNGRKLLILVATSGDTGSAIANAFYGLDNIGVVVLFPEKEVTPRQRKQMTTLGKNVSVIALDGKFDDCQKLVKQAFSDPDLRDLDLSSANSINFGRILPQAVYYFYAYSKLARRGEKIVFSVPSGNFGNMFGSVIAWRMGLPVERFVIAVNENDEFPKFMASGDYEKIVPSRNCLSSAMNVGHPSNLARLVDLFEGQLDTQGRLNKRPNMPALRDAIFTTSVSDEDTKKTIIEAYDRYGLLLEPHGAVGWKGLERYLAEFGNEPERLYVSVETAHPAKFPEQLISLIGIDPELPPALEGLEQKPENFDRLQNDYGEFKAWLRG